MKNAEVMKLLVELGNVDGKLLRTSWTAVIKCCSEIDILHSIAQRVAFWLQELARHSHERGGGCERAIVAAGTHAQCEAVAAAPRQQQ